MGGRGKNKMCAEQFPWANAEALGLQLKLRKALPLPLDCGQFSGRASASLTGVFCSVNCTHFEHSGHLYHVSGIESAAEIVVLHCQGNVEVCYSLNEKQSHWKTVQRQNACRVCSGHMCLKP